MTDVVLAVDKLTRRFGPLTAVDGLSLEVREGGYRSQGPLWVAIAVGGITGIAIIGVWLFRRMRLRAA
jgi:hypothetical protein